MPLLRLLCALLSAHAITGCASDPGTGVPPTPPASVAAIVLTPGALTLTPGASAQLHAEARQANGTVVKGASIDWSSSAANVASVSGGSVTAIAGGTATITATSGGHSAAAIVTVENVYDVDARGVPRFIDRDYIELAKIARVSRFRSGIGHDYSDYAERCRSMKHYYQPSAAVDWSTVLITAPVSGTVLSLKGEMTFGAQVQIVPNAQTAFTVILFHVIPVPSLTVGASVTAGQPIGTHIGSQTMSDVAIRVQTASGLRYVSYFDAMTDSLFQSYASRGVSSRVAMIISSAERDASPLTCSGEQFQNTGTLTNWVDLR